VSDIYYVVQDFTNIIRGAADPSINSFKIKFLQKRVPWWNNECREVIKTARSAFIRFIRRRFEEKKTTYKKSGSHARMIIKEAKNQQKTTTNKQKRGLPM